MSIKFQKSVTNGEVRKDLNKPESSLTKGWNPMGLIESKMAELPKDGPTVCSAFLFAGYSQEKVMKLIFQKVPI